MQVQQEEYLLPQPQGYSFLHLYLSLITLISLPINLNLVCKYTHDSYKYIHLQHDLVMTKTFKRAISLFISTLSCGFFGYHRNHTHSHNHRLRVTSNAKYFSYNMGKSSRPISLQVCLPPPFPSCSTMHLRLLVFVACYLYLVQVCIADVTHNLDVRGSNLSKGWNRSYLALASKLIKGLDQLISLTN